MNMVCARVGWCNIKLGYVYNILLHCFALWSTIHNGHAAKNLNNPAVLTNFAKDIVSALTPTLLDNLSNTRVNRSVRNFVLPVSAIKEINDNQISSSTTVNEDSEAKAQQNYVNQVQPYQFQRSIQYSLSPYTEQGAPEYYNGQNERETPPQIYADYYNPQNVRSQFTTTNNGLVRINDPANTGDNFANGANAGINIANGPNNNAPVQQQQYPARPFGQGQPEVSPSPFARPTLNADLNPQYQRFANNGYQRVRDNIQVPLSNARDYYGPPNLPGPLGYNPNTAYQTPYQNANQPGYYYPDPNGPYPRGQSFGPPGGIDNRPNIDNGPYPIGQQFDQSNGGNGQANPNRPPQGNVPPIANDPFNGPRIESTSGPYDAPGISPSYGPPIINGPFEHGPGFAYNNEPFVEPGYGPPLNHGTFDAGPYNNGPIDGQNNRPNNSPNNEPTSGNGVNIGGQSSQPPSQPINGNPKLENNSPDRPPLNEPNNNQQPLGERLSSPLVGSFRLESFPPSSYRLIQSDQLSNIFVENFNNTSSASRSGNLRGSGANTYLPPSQLGPSTGTFRPSPEARPGSALPTTRNGPIPETSSPSAVPESAPTPESAPLNSYGTPAAPSPSPSPPSALEGTAKGNSNVASGAAATDGVSPVKDEVETVAPIDNDSSRASSTLKLKLFLPSREFYENSKKIVGRILLTGSTDKN
ncbi:AAC-rich mRNA clone AAC11 protein-like [Prorops nasuta]|uniref:AAC-rich mRNA clone AAC11 protein-like n=1 Tax=Prorops nasuta TaxID=863751 RepID=UPI0034CE95A1